MAKTPAMFYGYNPPFFGGPQNVLSRQEDIRLIKNDLLQLLLTVPGERVMRPDFGVQLRSFVFEQSTTADLSSLEASILASIEAQEPRVIVDEVVVQADDERNGINVRVVARLKRDPSKDVSVEQFLAART
jgi:phage baseplate assembly protein W